jgi:hypothetical protein
MTSKRHDAKIFTLFNPHVEDTKKIFWQLLIADYISIGGAYLGKTTFSGNISSNSVGLS